MEHRILALILSVMSIVVAVEWTWLIGRIKPGATLAWLKYSPVKTALETLYFLGLPYLALISGLIPPRHFGLAELELITPLNFGQPVPALLNDVLVETGDVLLAWLPAIGPMASVGSILGGVFALCLWVYIRAENSAPGRPLPPIYRTKTRALFEVIHWSFYRATVWLLLDNLYLGVVGGILLMLVETAAAVRAGNCDNRIQQRAALRFGLGIIVSVAFLFAPNLWFMLFFQLILVWSSRLLLQIQRSPEPQAV